jgi:hypothetical protein
MAVTACTRVMTTLAVFTPSAGFAVPSVVVVISFVCIGLQRNGGRERTVADATEGKAWVRAVDTWVLPQKIS